jgi:NAD(P)-dependent dehydrogenase (short-subunit alcohol dehydrogenase family)
LMRGTFEDVTPEAMQQSYAVNCMGPIFTIQALLKQKLLKEGALVATLTSLVASITENESGGNYPYRCSKIAANMAVKSMSIDLAPRGITSTILHPGTPPGMMRVPKHSVTSTRFRGQCPADEE